AKLRVGVDLGTRTQAMFTAGYWRNRSDVRAQSRLRDADGGTVYAGPVRIGDEVWTLPESAFAPSARRESHRLLGVELSGTLGERWNWDLTASRYDLLRSREAEAAAPPQLQQGSRGSIADNGGSGWRTLDLRSSGPAGPAHTLFLGLHLDTSTLDS